MPRPRKPLLTPEEREAQSRQREREYDEVRFRAEQQKEHERLVDELRDRLAKKPRPVRQFASKAEKMEWLRKGLGTHGS